MNLTVSPMICEISENPNFYRRFPLFCNDHVTISFSLNMLLVFFWLLCNSVSRICILLFSIW